MKTVKEVSKLTGISVRTLHYYDEIGLLRPAGFSEAGYRLYDDKALEALQQILFFREFELPLKQIKAIMEHPQFDKNQLLSSQKKILVLKKERLERIINSINDILKGENKMDFEVFSKTDIDQMFNGMVNNMSDIQKDVFIEEFGSMEQFKEHFLKNASSEEGQKNYAKMVEWYGDKESAIAVATNPENSQIMEAYSKRYDAIIKNLATKVGIDVNSFEVKAIVAELDFVSRQLYQMKDMTAFMLDAATKYLNDKDLQKRLDEVYGDGSTEYFGRVFEAFYKRKD